MMRRLLSLALGASILLLSIWAYISWIVIRSDAPLRNLLAEKGTVILTPSLTDQLLSDLKSGDKARLEQWCSFLNQYTKNGTNYFVISSGLNETFELYNAREKPSRSNYFNRLVFELQAKHAATGLSKQAMLGFLGSPDVTWHGGREAFCDYRYWCDGAEFVTHVTCTNEMVARIDIGVMPR